MIAFYGQDFSVSRCLRLSMLLALLSITLASPVAQAQISVRVAVIQGKQELICTNTRLGKRVPCPDSQLFFFEGRRPVQAAFNAANFRALDEIYDEWCTGKDR